VHRPNYLDFIGIHHRDAAGRVVGEHVFVGLYATHVYHVSTNDIPVVRSKVAAVRAACGFAPGSYRDKALINVLETYPREELIEIATGDLQRIASGIVMLQEHPRVRVFLRNDSWGRYVSALVYMSRDRFDTTVRQRITKLLADTLRAESIDFFLLVGESRLARLHLIARMPAGTRYDHGYDAEGFEREVARIVRGWQDELQQNLIEHCGEERGNGLVSRYAAALPLAYQDQVPPSSAVSDLEHLEAAEKGGRIEVKLNAPYGEDGSDQHVKLFLKGNPRPLSAVLPVFENLGVTVLSEQPFKLADSDLHIADFAVRLPRADALEDEATRAAFRARRPALVDRREDFRTEVLGLVKAQQVKNAVIVPVGAKGGFYPKQLPRPRHDRDEFGRRASPPTRPSSRPARRHRQPRRTARSCRRRHVCATTATIPTSWSPPTRAPPPSPTSPTASRGIRLLAGRRLRLGRQPRLRPQEDGHHRARRLGSGQAPLPRDGPRHPDHEPFTVVGVGDMSGDVFGNGMLLSRHIRLVAAFDHRHIFIDPDPDPAPQLGPSASAVRPAALVLGRLRQS
jgi:NAD-specific glutamate dehydrogenase